MDKQIYRFEKENMKRTVICFLITMLALSAWAVPAKPGLWKTIRLTDGTEVLATLCGDEHAHFWMTEDGKRYVESSDADIYVPISIEQIQQRVSARRAVLKKQSSRLLSPKKVAIGDRTHYSGVKKGLVILVEFTDVKFKSSDNLAFYKRVLNEKNFSEGSFRGSVGDYFKAQSGGQFELDFDVVGPYKMKNNQKYYGENDAAGNDMRAEEMILEACEKADAEVNFADYDWDGDGEVDQVFVIFAGKGEADSDVTYTIWPHMWYLEKYGATPIYDGVRVNTYACSNELNGAGKTDGIGCICHEFSHCLGFPDFYDIYYSGWFGMSYFDLMAAGSYNDNCFCPPNYTAHEKLMCGWLEPTVLADKDTVITNMKSMSDDGETFIIYNDAHPDEYYTIENRQKTGWDTSYPAKGLMFLHIDFDKDIWECNIPNSKVTTDMEEYRVYHYPLNDHMRCTIMHADNDDDSKYWSTIKEQYSKTTLSTDLYPYKNNDSLTATSKPAITLYNKNAKGTKTADWGILDIKQNADGTMSFRYRAQGSDAGSDTTTIVTPVGDCLFYESFDQCTGTGGNDGLWNGTIASANFIADNEGWTAASDKLYGGSGCAKFGTSSIAGVATSPSFTINGKATLTFKAGAWNASADGTTLKVEAEGATITPSTFTIEKGNWTACTATLEGKGNVTLTFTPEKRFFLDEVKVVDASTSGITSHILPLTSNIKRIYTLDGRYVGTDLNALNRGIYIINGKKIVK